MEINHIGIIIGGAHSQSRINADHAREIGEALSSKYEIHYYDFSKMRDINRLIEDRRTKKVDIVFNNAAGKNGGDGTIEGFLNILGIPFVGSDMFATALAFNKKITKTVVGEVGVPIIKGMAVTLEEFHLNASAIVHNVMTTLGFPVVVKASEGSDSIGISLVKQQGELIPALERAFQEDEEVLIETFIRRQAEVTCMVIGNGTEAHALDPVERMYDTELLYAQDISSRSYRAPDVDRTIIDDIMRYSVVAHQALGCLDYSRSDFLIDKKGGIHFLEVNGHAGLGCSGPTAYTAQHTKGWDYPKMIESILEIAKQRYQ